MQPWPIHSSAKSSHRSWLRWWLLGLTQYLIACVFLVTADICAYRFVHQPLDWLATPLVTWALAAIMLLLVALAGDELMLQAVFDRFASSQLREIAGLIGLAQLAMVAVIVLWLWLQHHHNKTGDVVWRVLQHILVFLTLTTLNLGGISVVCAAASV